MNTVCRFILAFTLFAALGAAPATRPTTAIGQGGCVTAECHAGMKASKATHGPVAADTCDACHESVDVTKHTFVLARDGVDLCTYCHEFSASAMPVVHKPVQTGECLGCHDPHGGRDRSLTREASMKQLCGRCHDSVVGSHKSLHTPVKLGQCDSCHPPHGAMFPKLLDAVGTDLCLACHQDFDQQLAEVTNVHKALERGCEECHDVHASDQPMQLVKPALELCLSCHEKTRVQLASAKYKHSAATTGDTCLTCHTAHGSDTVRLMRDQPITLCMSCHNKEIRVDASRAIPAVKELRDDALHKHGAVKDGQCSGCHGAHGTDEPLLLTKRYSRTLYRPFDMGSYELCFACHDAGLVKQKSTATLTAFRNGERNLHWVHIRQDERGRSCYMCHTTHASPNDRNVRTNTPYKLWSMPIRFTKTASGGSCTPGCHTSWAYDRIAPVSSPATAPTVVSPPGIARAEQEGPAKITLSTRDRDGHAVRIPDPNRPTLLVLLGPQQFADEGIVRAISTAVPDANRAQVVLIGCGADESDLCDSVPWPIIPDPDRTISGELNVHGWPTALVIQSDGLEFARLGGSSESLALKLRPYLELAAQTLDRAAVEKKLAGNAILGEGAAHDLLKAQRLIADKKPREALKLLDEAIQRHPGSVDLRIATARALIDIDRDDEAKNVLKVVLDHNHELPDAHYLMGLIQEHAGDWEAAAKHYRAAGTR